MKTKYEWSCYGTRNSILSFHDSLSYAVLFLLLATRILCERDHGWSMTICEMKLVSIFVLYQPVKYEFFLEYVWFVISLNIIMINTWNYQSFVMVSETIDVLSWFVKLLMFLHLACWISFEHRLSTLIDKNTKLDSVHIFFLLPAHRNIACSCNHMYLL